MPKELLVSNLSTVQGNGCALLFKELFYLNVFLNASRRKKDHVLFEKDSTHRALGGWKYQNSEVCRTTPWSADVHAGWVRGEDCQSDCQCGLCPPKSILSRDLTRSRCPLLFKEKCKRKGSLEWRLPLGALGVGSKCLFPSDKSRVAGWEQ
jgi:hypothetical protein